MLEHPWQPDPYTSRVWSVVIPNYRDKNSSIFINLEADSAGKVWPEIIHGQDKIIPEQESYPDFDAAAGGALRAVLARLQELGATAPAEVLAFLPWAMGEHIGLAMDVDTAQVSAWVTGKRGMAKRSVIDACRLIGIKRFTRAEGYLYRLDIPYWETPEYTPFPIEPQRQSRPRQRGRPGKVGRPPNLEPTRFSLYQKARREREAKAKKTVDTEAGVVVESAASEDSQKGEEHE